MSKQHIETQHQIQESAGISKPECAAPTARVITRPDVSRTNLDKFALRPASLPGCQVIPEGQAGEAVAFGAWKTLGHSGRKI